MKQQFELWFSSLTQTISDYEYYMNFQTIFENVNKWKVELNILNSLIGSQNIEEEFEVLVSKYPEVLKCIPLLIAIRQKEIKVLDNNQLITFKFDKNYDLKLLKKFMNKIGLFDLLSQRKITNLFDYLTGIEVGLSSNSRKNKGGFLMENIVEEYFQKFGLVKDVDYFKEIYWNEIKDKWNIDLSSLPNNSKENKRFDFLIKIENEFYAIETNFYNSSGSKLNETIRSYIGINEKISKIDHFNFVWITDGFGWNATKNNLEQGYNNIKHMYNLNDLKTGKFLESLNIKK